MSPAHPVMIELSSENAWDHTYSSSYSEDARMELETTECGQKIQEKLMNWKECIGLTFTSKSFQIPSKTKDLMTK